jgi:NADPH:quinone reductase-like Zn-dependent oxidoreductase
MRAVRFDRYGGRDVLYIAELPTPKPETGQVLVEVRAAGINPGEASIREGRGAERFPATFPSGEGSDLAGVVAAVGPGVANIAVGDEVLGWSWTRSSHATHVVVPETQLIPKRPELTWEVAGALYVVGVTAYAAVHAVGVSAGDRVGVSAAAGGVGVLVTQLLATRGVQVLGIASEHNFDWLRAHGADPVAYGDGLADRLRQEAPGGLDAFIDLHGPEYVRLAVELGVPSTRINTIIAFEEAGRVGAKTDGSVSASTPEVLGEMADLLADGVIELVIAASYPLDRVSDAFAELEQRHTRGKIVLVP